MVLWPFSLGLNSGSLTLLLAIEAKVSTPAINTVPALTKQGLAEHEIYAHLPIHSLRGVNNLESEPTAPNTKLRASNSEPKAECHHETHFDFSSSATEDFADSFCTFSYP